MTEADWLADQFEDNRSSPDKIPAPSNPRALWFHLFMEVVL
jgi:hypothetical protein